MSVGEATLVGEGARPEVLFSVLQSGSRANGGVESVTQVIENLEGTRAIVVTQRSTPINDRWRSAGADLHVWPYGRRRTTGGLRRVRQILDLAWTNYRAYRLIRRRKIRVVHCNDLISLWNLGWGARAAGAAVVFNLRDVKAPDERYGPQWAAAWLASAIVCLSEEMKNSLERRLPKPPGSRRLPVRFIYSIVDRARMHPPSATRRTQLRIQFGIKKDELAIGYVAAFNRKKAQLRLIEEALPLLHKRLPSARVYFIGDFLPEHDPYARMCQESAARLGLHQVCRFVGYTDAVEEWYQALDLNLIASVREGLARGMIESIACGTPVVSYDVCSAKEVLEGFRCGEVVPQGASASLVDACVRLLNDRERMNSYSRNGIRAAREAFDAEVSAGEYERLYEQMSRDPKFAPQE